MISVKISFLVVAFFKGKSFSFIFKDVYNNFTLRKYKNRLKSLNLVFLSTFRIINKWITRTSFEFQKVWCESA